MYNKYELSLAYNKNSVYLEKVKQQYEYAKENLDSIKRVAGIETTTTASGVDN